jgi:hypothetical protein
LASCTSEKTGNANQLWNKISPEIFPISWQNTKYLKKEFRYQLFLLKKEFTYNSTLDCPDSTLAMAGPDHQMQQGFYLHKLLQRRTEKLTWTVGQVWRADHKCIGYWHFPSLI